MNVLIVGENVPNTSSGAAVASLGVVRAFRSGGWDVHLVVNARPWQLADLAAARALAASVVEVPRTRMRVTPVGDWLRCIARFRYFPRWQGSVLRAVEAALRERRFDLIVLDQIRAAEYGRLLKERGVRIPIALRAHNVEHVLNALLAPGMDAARERAETRLRAHRYREIETHLDRYCDVLLPISDVDGEKLAALNPGLPVAVIPSPVDTGHYRPAAYPPPGKEIVFVGGMGYGPNRDAATWFVQEILPRVVARHPDARFVAVGEKPPEFFREHAPHVQGVGFVPDERVHVERGRVFVAPIRWGSGVRTKILNALAMRRPVVSTTIGIEGLHLTNGRSVLVADDPQGFADAVCAVLEDDARASALAEEGLRACLDGYAPERVAERLRAAQQLVAGSC
jgi:glycosyltransferase involved in cell wall biosynthesis